MSRAYYNENNEFAAAWLRNLITAGLIADGEVDTRSILDVRPDDVRGFTQCHFFAGIGGWSYALRKAGWDDSRPAWTGSCPCQPFSLAGAQRGFADARHLWPIWRKLVAVVRPPVVFGEQVASATEWLRLVRGDLEEMGYAVGALPIQAASAGADHLRDRYWFVADADDPGPQGRRLLPERAGQRAAGADGVANPHQSGASEERQQRGGQFGGAGSDPGPCIGNVSDAAGEQVGAAGQPREHSGLEWVIGADGKARRVGPDVRRLVDGLSSFLGGLRSDFTQEVTEKMREYAEATQSRPDQVLQAMWGSVSPQDDRLPLGGQDRIYCERILLACLCECARRYDPAGAFGQSQEAAREILRGVQLDGELARSPRQRRHNGEYAGEHPDPLRSLSHSFSQYVVEAWSAHRRTNAKALRLLEHGVPNRVGLLRGFGNAIDHRPAKEFIAAYMSACASSRLSSHHLGGEK